MTAFTPLSIGTILAERYRIVKSLGQGDFGVMYKAWDTRLNNPCALKENLETSPEAEQQFTQQAAQLAGLRHPNLPVMIDHFTIPGQGQYLVMDFVPGEDLRTMLEKANGPLDEAIVLPWISQVCEALSYLHEHTTPIIHRDVKPANIRITPDGNAVLVDFGINKIFDITLKTTMGAQAVTAGFSPPELYGYGNADARSDVYALGATLYALLTGQTPVESVQRAIGIELPTPSSLNPRLTPQTEAAILKAMALLPADRYQSAAEFLADLPTPQAVTLHIDNLPATMLTPPTISTPASPAPPAAAPPDDLRSTRRLKKAAPPAASHPPTVRQASKRGLAAWGAWIGAAILLIAALAAGGYFINQELQGQMISATRLAQALATRTPTLTPTRTLTPSQTPTPAPPTLTPTFTATSSPTASDTPTPTLVPELPLLEGTSLPLGREVIAVDNVTELGLIARWGRGTIQEVAWSPDGDWLAVGGSIGIHIYDSHNQQVVAFIETEHGVNSVAFSPDGSLIAAGMEDNSVRLWQTADWALLHTISGHTRPVLSVAFAPDGSRLASGSEDSTIRLWRIPEGSLVRTFNQPTEPVTSVKYSPDGTLLATITGDGLARLWSVSSGTYVRTMADEDVPEFHNSVSFSPDGALLATGSQGTIQIWGVADGALISSVRAGAASTLVTFSPTGTVLASASEGGELRVAAISGATLLPNRRAHPDAVHTLAFSWDGARLATAGLDGSLRLWMTTTETVVAEIGGHSSYLTSMTITRNASYMATGFSRGAIQVRFPSNGALWQTWTAPYGLAWGVSDLAFSPNGSTLASASDIRFERLTQYGGDAIVWNPTNGERVETLSRDGSSVTYPPNGAGVMAGSYFFNLNGELLNQLDIRPNWGEPAGMEFSPDGTMLAVAYPGSELILFGASDLERIVTLVGHTDAVNAVTFSPDGTILASGSDDRTIRLWRVSDHTPLRTLRGHTGGVTGLAFTPDGAMLISSSTDRTIRLWRVGDGALLHTISAHTFDIIDVAISPDATLIYSASRDGTVRVWGLFVSWAPQR